MRQGECGLLVPVEDQSALENALTQLLTSEQQRALFRDRGIKRAKEFSNTTFSQQYLNLFEKLSTSKNEIRGLQSEKRIS